VLVAFGAAIALLETTTRLTLKPLGV